MRYTFRAFEDVLGTKIIEEDETVLDANEIIFQGRLENGYDWFSRKIELLEKDYGDRWKLATLMSINGIECDIVSRDNLYGGFSKKPPYTIIPLAILLSAREPTSNFSDIFSGHVVSTIELKEYPYHCDYKKPFSFDHLYFMIFRFLEMVVGSFSEYDDFDRVKYCSFITSPSSVDLFTAQTLGQFNVILNIQSVSDACTFNQKILQLSSLIKIKNQAAYQEKILQDLGSVTFKLPGVVSQLESQIDSLVSDIRNDYFVSLNL